ERGRLAGPGGPGHEHESLGTIREFLDDSGQTEFLERADLVRDEPNGRPHRAALPIHVAAKAREVLDAEGDIQLALLLEPLLLGIVEDAVGQTLRVLWREDLEFGERHEASGDPDLRIRPRRDMQVGRSAIHDDLQEVADVRRHRRAAPWPRPR